MKNYIYLVYVTFTTTILDIVGFNIFIVKFKYVFYNLLKVIKMY